MPVDPVVFHLPASVLRGTEDLAPFYEKLIAGLRDRGAEVRQVLHDRARILAEVEADGGFHIVDHGAIRHPRILNTGVAYIYPFRNMDPWGIRALSSISAMPFDPAAIDPAAATAFADKLRRRLIGKRTSRYEQPEARQAVPKGCIAVFLQSEGHRSVEETCHLDLRAMLGAVLAVPDGRPVVVKPHPRDHDAETRLYLRRLARRHPRLQVVEANIHDILQAADVAVTINSATGIEAMLHGCPVVLCGQADFHHQAITVRQPDEMAYALHEALIRSWHHDAFLYWYFAQNCLSAMSPTLVDDLLARIAATGYDPSRLLP